MKPFFAAVNGTECGTKFWGQCRASLVPGTSLVILHKFTLPAVQRTRRRLQDEDQSDLWGHVLAPAVHPPNVPVDHQELEPGGEVSGGGFELGRAQMRSFWMLQKREQGFQELFDIAAAWETPPNNRGTVLYGFVQNPSLQQNWIS